MKTTVVCFDCWEPGAEGPQQGWAELLDDGFLWFECDKGHAVATTLQEHKFEVLFEFGAMALVDGYHREAVSGFASALERFYEFYIRVVCKHHGVDAAQFTEAWKVVASQSERQLGAFLFTHLLETKERCAWLETKWVELRNNAVHKGYLPTGAEALGYGERALSLMIPLLRTLRATHPGEMQEVYGENLVRVTEIAKRRTPTRLVSMTIPIVLRMRDTDDQFGRRTLEQELPEVERRKTRFWTPPKPTAGPAPADSISKS